MLKIHHLKLIDHWLGAALARLLPKPSLRTQGAGTPDAVLLIRPGGIGDAVHLIPAIQALKKFFPNIGIDILAERRNAGAFALTSGIREVFLYDQPGQLLRLLGNSYDVVIDTEQWHRLSAVVTRLVRAPVKIGFATNNRVRMFTHGIPYSHDDYEMISFLHLLAPLGITDAAPHENPWLQIPEAVLENTRSLLSVGEFPFKVVLFPGASIAEKRWGSEKFYEVAKWCLDRGWKVAVVGGKEDCPVAEAVASGLDVVNLAGQTSLAETAAIIRKALVVVSGDSGILHIAAGLGCATVALFGPGSAAKWAPRGSRHVVLNKNLPCSPCTRFGYTPPCPHNNRCMREITVDEVTRAVGTVINEE